MIGNPFRSIFLCCSCLILMFASVYQAASPSAKYRKHGAVLLNDLAQTPGLVRTKDLKIICGETTGQFRATTEKMKNEVYAEYGVVRDKGVCRGGCEVDHLISLELGGADDVKNLWPQPSQPKPGFHEKDQLENWLHRQVCKGRPTAMSIEDAQRRIADDWYALYLEMQKEELPVEGKKQ